MREVEPGNIHASHRHLLYSFFTTTCRTQGTDYFGLSLFFHAVFASSTIFELENMQVKNAPEEPFCIIST